MIVSCHWLPNFASGRLLRLGPGFVAVRLATSAYLITSGNAVYCQVVSNAALDRVSVVALRCVAMSDQPTIFALSSGRPPVAIAVIRISGSRAGAALTALGVKIPAPRKAGLARIRDPRSGEIIDEALVLWFGAAGARVTEADRLATDPLAFGLVSAMHATVTRWVELGAKVPNRDHLIELAADAAWALVDVRMRAYGLEVDPDAPIEAWLPPRP